MQENDKAELIKKIDNKTEKTDSQTKRIVVVKKVTKKVIIKKHPSKNEDRQDNEVTDATQNTNSESKNQNSIVANNTDGTIPLNKTLNNNPTQVNRNTNSYNNNTGGYNNNRPNTNTGGYNNNRPNTNTGGYNNNNTGGYNNNRPNTNTGGYNNNRPNTNTGGYNNNRPNTNTGGYNNNNTGGYNNNNTGGYNNNNTGGYNNNRPNTNTGGYNNNNTGGYNNNRPTNNYVNRTPGNTTGNTGNPNYVNRFGNNRPAGTGQPGAFGQNRNTGNRPPYVNRGRPAPTTQPLPTVNDKDKARKKLNNKKYDAMSKNRYGYQDQEIQKIFNKKKKEKSAMESVPEFIEIIDVVSISDLAKKMNLKSSIIIQKLMELGTMVTINDKIDSDTASIVAAEFDCKVVVVSLYDQTIIEEEKSEAEDLLPRPPIVTVMGHVDHGKTKLLDAIRSSDVVAGESGGITQHIGAYSVAVHDNKKITFIDTPGHEAFTMMRARGAQVTDIVILVVAADDGVMPQTVEAINHAKAAKVPIIVAINKIDKPDANPDRVKQQLTEYDLLPEEWGGHTLYCNVSALKKQGLPDLLETILLQAEMIDMKTSYKMRANGYVIESRIDQGRGVVATVLILKGTLKIGDYFIAGVYAGKIRAMNNDHGEKIKIATPSMPIEIMGFEDIPKAGDPFNVTVNEKESKLFASKRQELAKMEEAKLVKKITLKDMLAQKKEGEVQEIKVLIKADVQGSVEAIKDSLIKLSNSEIKIVVVSVGVGAINKDDVNLAVASNAIIIGFHVRPNPMAASIADKAKVEIRRYNIIFDVIDDIKASMEGMIKPDLQEEFIGNIEVKQVFKISKVGVVAGCIVTSGKVKRNSLIRIMRDDVLIHSGKITTLRRFKDEASEVHEGTECGIGIENYKDIREGDIFEAYEIKEIVRKLLDVEKQDKLAKEKLEIEKEKEKLEKEKLEKEKLEKDKKPE